MTRRVRKIEVTVGIIDFSLAVLFAVSFLIFFLSFFLPPLSLIYFEFEDIDNFSMSLVVPLVNASVFLTGAACLFHPMHSRGVPSKGTLIASIATELVFMIYASILLLRVLDSFALTEFLMFDTSIVNIGVLSWRIRKRNLPPDSSF